MNISRAEGYRRGRGKEAPSIDIVRDFLTVELGLHPPSVIIEPERNRTHGDLDFGGATAECKSQPIDPDRYERNFVEVMEDTTELARDHHRDGLDRTAQILGIGTVPLAFCPYRDFRVAPPVRRAVGDLQYVSCSLASIAGSELTIYVNPDPDRTFVYVYRRRFLLNEIRKAVLSGSMSRARGNSNQDTFGVFVAVPPARWRRFGNTWRFVGPDTDQAPAIREQIRAQVSPPEGSDG